MIVIARSLLARLTPVIGMAMGAMIVYLMFLVTVHKSAALACIAEYATHVSEESKRDAHERFRELENAHHAAVRDIAISTEEGS